MAAGGNPFAGTRLGNGHAAAEPPRPRPRTTTRSGGPPSKPTRRQPPADLFDDDDDPFSDSRPRLTTLQPTLDSVGLSDEVDPEDPFGIGKPLLLSLESLSLLSHWGLGIARISLSLTLLQLDDRRSLATFHCVAHRWILWKQRSSNDGTSTTSIERCWAHRTRVGWFLWGGLRIHSG